MPSCRAHRAAAAVLRAAAAVVPGPARARTAALQHARAAAPGRARSTRPRWSARSHELVRRATRRCAPRSREEDGAARAGHRVRLGTAHWRVVDLRALPEPRSARTRRGGSRCEEARRPFDLARGPLLRATLLRLGEQEHVLLLTMHHIVSDGWSMGVLVREVARPLRGLPRGTAARRCPSCPCSTRTTRCGSASWLAGRGAGARSSRTGASSWRERPRVLELPTDRPRPAVQTSAARALPLRGSPPRSGAAAARARPARGRHALHDAARGLPGAAVALQRAGRRRAWARPSPAAPAPRRRA